MEAESCHDRRHSCKNIAGFLFQGGEFRAIYVNEPLDETPPLGRPTPPQVQAALEEIEALIKGEHNAAAFVTGWAALEALARLAHADMPLKQLSPVQAIQVLAEEGFVQNEAADRLRSMAKLRNAVVHGDFSADVAPAQARELLDHLRTIACDIASTQT